MTIQSEGLHGSANFLVVKSVPLFGGHLTRVNEILQMLMKVTNTRQ